MHRKLKALGLALVAALALTAVMASAASAQFTSTSTHTILSGTQEGNHVFTAGEGFGGVTCTEASFSGTGTATEESEQKITPTYSNCTDSFGRVVDLDNSSLAYTFTSGASKGTVDISGSMTLTITDSKNHESAGSVICTVTIGAQTGVNGVTYHDNGEGVKVTSNSTNVKNTTSGGFFNCGIGNGEHSAGTYKGTTNMTGKNTSGTEVDIDVD
jgi:hypothetical protein